MKTQINTKKYIKESFVLATIITGLLLLATVFIAKNEINWIETASVYFSFACTWLCTRQVRFSYVLAVISTSLLVITFWQADLLGSMALNIYLIPTVIYGYFIWGKDSNPKLVERVKSKSIALYVLFTAVTWAGAYWVITALGGQMGALDGWLLVGTVLAQYLLDRKKIETWVIWILVDVVSIYVYWQAGLYLLAAQFVLFGANAVFAFFQWRKTMNEDANATLIKATPTILAS
jgi:nicotinamide mononucleotide transporter